MDQHAATSAKRDNGRHTERTEKFFGYVAAAGAAVAFPLALYATPTVLVSGVVMLLIGVGLTICATCQFMVAAAMTRDRRENVSAPLDEAFAGS